MNEFYLQIESGERKMVVKIEFPRHWINIEHFQCRLNRMRKDYIKEWMDWFEFAGYAVAKTNGDHLDWAKAQELYGEAIYLPF